MKPGFGETIAHGIVDGIVGVLSQPLVIIALVVVIGLSILARRLRRR